MDTNERPGLCARMVREMDPYAVPVTSIGRHNRLPAGYPNKSLHTHLTAGAGRGISDAETSGSPRDMPKVVPVSGMDAATGPAGASLPERAPAFTPLVSPPPRAPAGRPALCQLPGRFPPTHNAAGTAAQDRIVPRRSEPSVLVRKGARLGRPFRMPAALGDQLSPRSEGRSRRWAA
jgi:hypothetical protein